MSRHYSKLITDLPALDIVITMGCNVQCPMLPCSYREDWGLEDPTGMEDSAYVKTAQQIEQNMIKLRDRFLAKQIDIEPK